MQKKSPIRPYIEALVGRLDQLQLVCGESELKLDTLNRWSGCVIDLFSAESSSYFTSENMNTLRVFILDWDRVVRASVFRLLRLGLSTGSEKLFLDKYIDVFTIIRLESSKSSVERVAILRFIEHWLKITESSALVEYFLKSINELVIGQLSSRETHLSPFVSCLVDLSISTQRRFPRIDVIKEFFEAVFPVLSKDKQNTLLDLLVFVCNSVGVVSIAEEIATTDAVFEYLLRISPVGIFILVKSTSKILQYPDVVMGAMSAQLTHPLCFTAEILEYMNEMLPGSSCRVSKNEDKLAVCVNEMNPSSVEFHQISRLGPTVYTEHSILQQITSLSNLVQWKAKAHALSFVKCSNPSIFQCVTLWINVHERIRRGQFNLQTKRFIHGLFQHSFCLKEHFELL